MQPRSPRVEILLSVARRICRGCADLNPRVRFFDFRPADRVHCHCSLGSFIRHGGRGRSRCRVHDDVQETRLAVRSLAEEAELAAYPIDNP
jgi:hypothetical protein